jgi:actin-binding protein anillin
LENKDEGGEEEKPLPVASKGSVTISGLSLPLQGEFVSIICEGITDNYVHHFIVMIRHRELFVSTRMVSLRSMGVAQQNCLVLPNSITLSDLEYNFKITIEIYALQTKRECIDYDVKYHIKKADKGKMRLTPKKASHNKDSMKTPPNTGRMGISPRPSGTPAIHKLSFSLVGTASLTIDNIQMNKLTLLKVPHFSPLSGILHLDMSCENQSEIEASGFLTVFEEVAGLGCWQSTC